MLVFVFVRYNIGLICLLLLLLLRISTVVVSILYRARSDADAVMLLGFVVELQKISLLDDYDVVIIEKTLRSVVMLMMQWWR